jgi:hypothetical protein
MFIEPGKQCERRFIKLGGEDAATTVITFNLNANLPGPDGVHGMARWETIAPEYKNEVADWLAQKLSAKQETGK